MNRSQKICHWTPKRSYSIAFSPEEDSQIHKPHTIRPTIPVRPRYNPKAVEYEEPLKVDAWTQTNPNDASLLLSGVNMRLKKFASADVTFESNVPTDEHQIQAIIKAEASAENKVNVAAEMEAKVYAKAKLEADLQAKIDAEVTKKIDQIANEIEGSGGGGVIMFDDNSNELLTEFGQNGTKIKLKDFEGINWSDPKVATRTLLTSLFKRDALATYSMTGKPSPAFRDRNRRVKRQLNPKIISDIEFVVINKCKVEKKVVRTTITTKCADENKMLKLRQSRLVRNALEAGNKVIKYVIEKEGCA